MTGKEALKQLEETYHKYITEWYYMSNMSKEERSRLYSMYDEEIKIIDKELTKYKRAFEILKEKGHVKVQIRECKEDKWYEVGFINYGVGHYRELTKEEYELLEELTNNESR